MAEADENVRGIYHLANNPELYEPQRQNNFELQITGLEKLADIYNTEFDNGAIKNAADVIRFSLAEAAVPKFAQDPITIGYGNNDIKFAGRPKWNEEPISLNDYIGAKTKEVMLAWQRLSYNPKTQKVGRAKDYKKVAYLTEYTPDYQVVRTWKLVGCWVSDLDFDGYNAEQSGRVKMKATLQYDYAYPEIDE